MSRSSGVGSFSTSRLLPASADWQPVAGAGTQPTELSQPRHVPQVNGMWMQVASLAQTSWVQALPSSSHVDPTMWGRWLQNPPPSQTSVVQLFPSLGHGVNGASKWHVEEQQSPSALLPSSQSSPAVTMPLPQRVI